MAYVAPSKLTPDGTELERALLAELRKLQAALAEAPANVRDGRATTPVKTQPGEVIRVGAGFTVILPHPRPSRGQTVYLMLDGTADILAQSGLVNGAASVGVEFAGLVVAMSSGEGWSVTRTPDTATQILDSLGTAQGSLLYRNASEWTVLAPGTSGRFLQTLGAGADPAWAALPTASTGTAGILETATATEQATGTDVSRATTPGTQQFHLSAAKFWVNGTPNSTTIMGSYNVTSQADTATGQVTWTIATDFANNNWAAIPGFSVGAVAQCISIGSKAAGSVRVDLRDAGTDALVDPSNNWYCAGFGEL